MRFPSLVIVMFSLCLLLVASVAQADTSLSSFNSGCIMSTSTGSISGENPDICGGDKKKLCKKFTTTLEEQAKDRESCYAACKSANSALYTGFTSFQCNGARRRGYSLCQQYCQQNFPK